MSVSARSRAAAAGAFVVLGAIATGALLLAFAMASYPGGTVFDATAPGHSFWANFLCDLMSDVAVNGRPNPAGSTFARTAMIVLATASGFFWLILPGVYHAAPRRLSLVTRTSGVLSVGGLVAVPVASGFLHVVAVFASSIPALVAGTLGIIGTWGWGMLPAASARQRSRRSRYLGWLAVTTVAVGLLDSILYAQSYLTIPRVVSPGLPFFQRVGLLLMLVWMSTVALQVLRSRGRTPGE